MVKSKLSPRSDSVALTRFFRKCCGVVPCISKVTKQTCVTLLKQDSDIRFSIFSEQRFFRARLLAVTYCRKKLHHRCFTGS